MRLASLLVLLGVVRGAWIPSIPLGPASLWALQQGAVPLQLRDANSKRGPPAFGLQPRWKHRVGRGFTGPRMMGDGDSVQVFLELDRAQAMLNNLIAKKEADGKRVSSGGAATRRTSRSPRAPPTPQPADISSSGGFTRAVGGPPAAGLSLQHRMEFSADDPRHTQQGVSSSSTSSSYDADDDDSEENDDGLERYSRVELQKLARSKGLDPRDPDQLLIVGMRRIRKKEQERRRQLREGRDETMNAKAQEILSNSESQKFIQDIVSPFEQSFDPSKKAFGEKIPRAPSVAPSVCPPSMFHRRSVDANKSGKANGDATATEKLMRNDEERDEEDARVQAAEAVHMQGGAHSLGNANQTVQDFVSLNGPISERVGREKSLESSEGQIEADAGLQGERHQAHQAAVSFEGDSAGLHGPAGILEDLKHGAGESHEHAHMQGFAWMCHSAGAFLGAVQHDRRGVMSLVSTGLFGETSAVRQEWGCGWLSQAAVEEHAGVGEHVGVEAAEHRGLEFVEERLSSAVTFATFDGDVDGRIDAESLQGLLRLHATLPNSGAAAHAETLASSGVESTAAIGGVLHDVLNGGTGPDGGSLGSTSTAPGTDEISASLHGAAPVVSGAAAPGASHRNGAQGATSAPVVSAEEAHVRAFGDDDEDLDEVSESADWDEELEAEEEEADAELFQNNEIDRLFWESSAAGEHDIRIVYVTDTRIGIRTTWPDGYEIVEELARNDAQKMMWELHEEEEEEDEPAIGLSVRKATPVKASAEEPTVEPTAAHAAVAQSAAQTIVPPAAPTAASMEVSTASPTALSTGAQTAVSAAAPIVSPTAVSTISASDLSTNAQTAVSTAQGLQQPPPPYSNAHTHSSSPTQLRASTGAFGSTPRTGAFGNTPRTGAFGSTHAANHAAHVAPLSQGNQALPSRAYTAPRGNVHAEILSNTHVPQPPASAAQNANNNIYTRPGANAQTPPRESPKGGAYVEHSVLQSVADANLPHGVVQSGWGGSERGVEMGQFSDSMAAQKAILDEMERLKQEIATLRRGLLHTESSVRKLGGELSVGDFVRVSDSGNGKYKDCWGTVVGIVGMRARVKLVGYHSICLIKLSSLSRQETEKEKEAEPMDRTRSRGSLPPLLPQNKNVALKWWEQRQKNPTAKFASSFQLGPGANADHKRIPDDLRR